jgi:hypothetical protein
MIRATRCTARILQPALVLAVIASAITAQASAAAPQITGLSDAALPRSGRLIIFGSSFGSAQGTGQVRIDGVDAIATTWMDTEIHAYVPEAAALGDVPG